MICSLSCLSSLEGIGAGRPRWESPKDESSSDELFSGVSGSSSSAYCSNVALRARRDCRSEDSLMGSYS